MTLGDKIKQARLQRGLTQSALCEGGITRNMLSRIENGTALPSIDTLEFLAGKLGIPTGYLLSDEYDTELYVFHDKMKQIRQLFGERKYRDCITKSDKLSIQNDEISYILAYSHFYVGIDFFRGGSMQSAAKHFDTALLYSDKTIYDTSRIRTTTLLYRAVCENTTLPLLNFDRDAYLICTLEITDYDFFKYLTQDNDHVFSNERYGKHIRAKSLMKERRYEEATKILCKIEDNRQNYPPDAYLMLSVYTDLESCYKNICDFEKAYKYSSKRISLMEGFLS